MSSDTPPPAGPRTCGPLLAVGLLALAAPGSAADPPRFPFTRLVAHWDQYADPGYLKFVEDARPEVAQVGFYGGHFWSLGHTPQYNGYPAHFPVRGLMSLRSVRFLTPEQPEERTLDATVSDGRVRFTLPEFLVYGVVRLELEPRR